jgi:hypothetical protein
MNELPVLLFLVSTVGTLGANHKDAAPIINRFAEK